jgi:Flp pilus assembly protein TadG
MRQSWASQTIFRLRSLASDASGVVAIEFALIAPLLMVMTFGTFEVSRALIVHKRFQRSVAMVGDLVSREEQLGTTYDEAKAQLSLTMAAAVHAMLPYSATPLEIGVYQFRAKSTDATLTRVEWSYAYHNMPIQNCSLTYTTNSLVPAGLLSTGDAAIIINATYQYNPLLTNIIPGLVKQMTWTNTMTFSPRYGSVFYGQATQNTTCPPS